MLNIILKHLAILLLVFFYACNNRSAGDSVKKTQPMQSEIPKKYETDLSDIRSPLGRIIKYKRTGDIFQIQWFQNGLLQTFTERDFDVNGADAWIPRFKDENENYIFLRAGCGNPCWVGIFLPLNGNQKPKLIHEYLAYDLKQNYVAYLNYDRADSLEILNIKSNRGQRFKLPNCPSAFKGYCLDTIYFDKKKLKYVWDSLINWETKVRHIDKFVIKI